ncbi:hypothetical protein TetV_192 [Tetraselmis virus 1]|uniref:Uncharacterized protein n=1 Tax=Tetraselmis virus 1 TaxID=2060617 RepID=A0A2P0VMZ8_9VIRU|nr:hypothetical protein QJ968_gp192 [Tetraselmis virus 1]AUF82284.1 hypothetical protein TetV_192 [Tetraselmis virus 1]
MTDQAVGTSTPLAQLRAAAAAAAASDSAIQEIQQVAPEVAPVVPVPSPPPPAVVAAPPPAPPPVEQTPVASPPAETPPDVSSKLTETFKELKQIAADSGNKSTSLLNSSSLKLGVAVMILFVVVGMLPVDAIVNKFSFMKRVPAASTLIKALTTGIATAAVSSNLCKIS